METFISGVTAFFTMAMAFIALYAVFVARRQLRQSERSLVAATVSAREMIQSSLESTQNTMEHDGIVNRVLKTVDVSIHCSQRYVELSNLRLKILKIQGIIERKNNELNELLEAKKGKPGEATTDSIKISFDQAISVLNSEIEERNSLMYLMIDDYYRTFWGLKSDQFDYWLMGVLDHDAFFDWSFYLAVKIIRENGTKKDDNSFDRLPISLRDSWEKWSSKGSGVNHGGSNPAFVIFTQKLFEIAAIKTKVDDVLLNRQVIDAMEEAETQPEGAGRVSAADYRKFLWSGKLDFQKFKEMTRK